MSRHDLIDFLYTIDTDYGVFVMERHEEGLLLRLQNGPNSSFIEEARESLVDMIVDGLTPPEPREPWWRRSLRSMRLNRAIENT